MRNLPCPLFWTFSLQAWTPPPRPAPPLGFKIQGSGFRVQGSGFRIQGSGFRIWDEGLGDYGLVVRNEGTRG